MRHKFLQRTIPVFFTLQIKILKLNSFNDYLALFDTNTQLLLLYKNVTISYLKLGLSDEIQTFIKTLAN